MMKTELTLTVEGPEIIDRAQLVRLVQMVIDIGHSDAVTSVDDENCDGGDADVVSQLTLTVG